MAEPNRKPRRADRLPPEAARPLPDRAGEPSSPDILKTIARREHSLLSLMELSNELTVSLDLFGIADLALFNIMGQLGTSKAALWIAPKEEGPGLVLLRSPGISKHRARSVGSLCGSSLIEACSIEKSRSSCATPLPRSHRRPINWPSRRASPCSHRCTREASSWPWSRWATRIGGEPYGQVELQVLHASLGMVGVALENAALYNRLQEQHRQLQVANQELKELDQLKSEFLRNVNHELRTPLTVVIAYLMVLEEMETAEGQRKEFLRTALDEGNRLQGLIETTSRFVRFEHRGSGDPIRSRRSCRFPQSVSLGSPTRRGGEPARVHARCQGGQLRKSASIPSACSKCSMSWSTTRSSSRPRAATSSCASGAPSRKGAAGPESKSSTTGRGSRPTGCMFSSSRSGRWTVHIREPSAAWESDSAFAQIPRRTHGRHARRRIVRSASAPRSASTFPWTRRSRRAGRGPWETTRRGLRNCGAWRRPTPATRSARPASRSRAHGPPCARDAPSRTASAAFGSTPASRMPGSPRRSAAQSWSSSRSQPARGTERPRFLR